MLPSLLPGQRYDKLLAELLRRMVTAAQNARGQGGSSRQRVERYLSFGAQATAQLRHAIRPADLDQLLHTRRYWTVVGLSPESQAAVQLVDLELPDCIERLENSAAAVDAEWRRWEDAGVLVVPDTNVFLHVLESSIREADWPALAHLSPTSDVTIVLLLVVLDELDKAKRGNHRTQARRVLREIDQLLADRTSVELPSSVGKGLVRVEVLVDDLDHESLPRADREIIDRTVALVCRAPARVYLLTGDTGMAIRARHAGLRCVQVPTPDK